MVAISKITVFRKHMGVHMAYINSKMQKNMNTPDLVASIVLDEKPIIPKF